MAQRGGRCCLSVAGDQLSIHGCPLVTKVIDQHFHLAQSGIL
jgi:hypothetical protein